MDQIIEFTPVLTFFVLYTGLLFGAIAWMLKAHINPIKELLTNHITETNQKITETNQKITETNQKIETLNAETNKKIETLNAETNQKIETLNAETNKKIDALKVELTSSIKDTNTNIIKLYEILLQQTTEKNKAI